MSNIKPIIELELYIIRHGQSMGNIERNTDGLSITDLHDPRLTDLGKKQAIACGERFKNTEFDAVYSSALLRAVQTATEIIKKQPNEKTLKILPLLTEAGVSPEYSHSSFTEINKINENAILADDVDPTKSLFYYNSTSDEADLFERAEKALEYIKAHQHEGEKIAVVSHAAFITYLVFSLMGYKKECPFYDLDFKNTGVTKVTIYKKGTNKYGDIVFEFINDTSHLYNL
jgi:broad specificity phosphatase PhoE